MRRHAKAEEILPGKLGPRSQALGQVILRTIRVGRWKIDDTNPDCSPHPRRQGRANRRFRKKIHIVETGDPATQHFSAGKQRPIVDKVRRHMALLGRPNMFVEPDHQRLIIGKTAQQGHCRVRMQVD